MRIPQTESIFARMTSLANQEGALNLAQGLMWLPPDPALLEEAARAFSDPTLHQYSLPAGILDLREVIAGLSERFFGATYDPASEVTITAGATEALFAAVQALTQPGDEAVFIEPAYDSYLPAFQIGSVRPYAVKLQITSTGIHLPWEEVEKRLSPKTRLLLLNFPHNPTGRTLHEEDLKALEHIVELYPQLTLIVDEAYEYMQWHPNSDVTESLPPLSVRQSPLLRERSIIVGSLGKIVGATGWRLGYVLAPAPLSKALRAVHQFITFCAATPLQFTLARYLGASPDKVLYFHAALLERRKIFIRHLRTFTHLEVLPPEGGYFVLVRPPSTNLPDTTLAEELTRKAKVASIPLSPFYGDGINTGWLRLCFARPTEMLIQAAQQLGRVYPAGLPSAHLTE